MTEHRSPGVMTGWPPSRGRHGNVVLVRNHEVNNPGAAWATAAAPAYDAMARGGTTTIVVTKFGEVVRRSRASTAPR